MLHLTHHSQHVLYSIKEPTLLNVDTRLQVPGILCRVSQSVMLFHRGCADAKC